MNAAQAASGLDSAGSDDHRRQRALWRSRRGMLELDLVLARFARLRYQHLADADQRAYLELLRLDDWVIWDWLQRAWAAPSPCRDHSAAGRNAPAHLARIISLVAAEAETRGAETREEETKEEETREEKQYG